MKIVRSPFTGLVLVVGIGAGILWSTHNTFTQSKGPIWTEKTNPQSLVVLPDFSPIVEALDRTIVNVSGTTDPQKKEKAPKQPERGAPRGPSDPFSSPEEFFEKFFGNPFRDQQAVPRRTLGSGFIISKDGYILTNNHVVEGSDKIEITLLDSEGKAPSKDHQYQATIVGRDPATDVALLKIKVGFELPVAPLGKSEALKKGDWVLAFGNPFGLDHSVSAGIVSAVGREISPNMNRRFDDFIQTDAAINFGNSGGPLVNLKGEVIGINTAITAQGSGIGFAVPIDLVKDVVPQLRESGSVTRGYLGIMIQDVTDDLKEAMGLATAKGVLVNDIVEDGPASKSNLKRGDVILKVDGQETADARALQKLVAKIKPGDDATLDILRDKKPLTIKVKVGNLSESKAPGQEEPSEPQKADKLGIGVGMNSDGKAVQIQELDPASAAAEAGLRPGDLIRRVNRQALSTVAQYQKIVSSLKSKQTVLFDIERGDIKLFIAFKVP